jgi:SAM-dependent methyltransferase
MTYQEENVKTIEGWIQKGWEWGIPFSHELCEKIRKGDFPFYLTPTKRMPREWLRKIKGKKILGLASGGGQQMALLSLLGGICTVFDYSEKQLESDLMVALREGYNIKTVKGDFTKPLPFPDKEFDIIINPVSLVYADKLEPIFVEASRVLRTGGVFVGGFDNGLNFISNDEKTITNRFPFNPLVNPEQEAQLKATDDGYEFSHTLEETLGGLLKARFSITGIYEDYNKEGPLSELRIPTFYAVRAKKR